MEIPSPRSARRARIEIIPLIDIIFFLLATFVMVSMSMVKSKGIPVNLPDARTGLNESREEDFTTVTVSGENEIFFNREAITMEMLEARLNILKQTQPDPKVFVNGDEDSRLGTAIGILDTIRKVGITRVAFETKPISSLEQNLTPR
jgi:biopolymer transport protein ExbD